MSPRKHGFSLLELVVVLALLAIALVVLLPRWQQGRSQGLASHVEQVREALQEAKLRAMASGQEQAFVWNPSTRVWSVGSTQGQIPSNVQIAMTFGQERQAQSLRPQIVFFADGLSTGGSLLFTTEGQSRQLEVDWLTGQVQDVLAKP